jgi:cyclophilin family peptidyl-prolyl cis-trans isomerase
MKLMKRIFLSIVLLISLHFFTFCQTEQKVIIETEYGNITILLYDETPIHRDNFIKLASEGFYDGTIFHRVINEFMIQGGDLDSRNAGSNSTLGAGDPAYKLDAEIVFPKYFHKKGALAAARQSDQVNPEKKSSGSQFYIVHGKVYENEELNQFEAMLDNRQRQQVMMRYFEPFRQQFMQMQQMGDNEGIQALVEKLNKDAEPELALLTPYKIAAEHREAYTTIGGTPHLDGEYTVFGEVVDGLDVIDKIASIETGNMDRPVKDIKMTVKVVK